MPLICCGWLFDLYLSKCIEWKRKRRKKQNRTVREWKKSYKTKKKHQHTEMVKMCIWVNVNINVLIFRFCVVHIIIIVISYVCSNSLYALLYSVYTITQLYRIELNLIGYTFFFQVTTINIYTIYSRQNRML